MDQDIDHLILISVSKKGDIKERRNTLKIEILLNYISDRFDLT